MAGLGSVVTIGNESMNDGRLNFLSRCDEHLFGN